MCKPLNTGVCEINAFSKTIRHDSQTPFPQSSTLNFGGTGAKLTSWSYLLGRRRAAGIDLADLPRGSACVFWTRCGSVRLDSVRFRVRFRPVPELMGSVRFGSVRPVRFGLLFLPVDTVRCCVQEHTEQSRATRRQSVCVSELCQ